MSLNFSFHMGSSASSTDSSTQSDDGSSERSCKDVRHYRENRKADEFNCRLGWIAALGEDMKLEFNEGDGWQYLLALTESRPYYNSEDSR